MDLKADLSQVFSAPLVALDRETLARFLPRKFPFISDMIDGMGELSAEAQGLKRVLTSYEKCINGHDPVTVYILWEPSNASGKSTVVGMLKVGHRNLYLYTKDMKDRRPCRPLCILDFYVHASRQRMGFGHRIYDFMLNTEGVNSGHVAIDRPSPSLLSFMSKHYRLEDPIWQNTNYVVYPQFFQESPKATDAPAPIPSAAPAIHNEDPSHQIFQPAAAPPVKMVDPPEVVTMRGEAPPQTREVIEAEAVRRSHPSSKVAGIGGRGPSETPSQMSSSTSGATVDGFSGNVDAARSHRSRMSSHTPFW